MLFITEKGLCSHKFLRKDGLNESDDFIWQCSFFLNSAFKRILWDAVMHSQTVSAKSPNKLICTMIPAFKTVLHMGLQDGICYQT